MTSTDLFTVYDDGDIDTNRTRNTDMHELIAQRYSRRDALRGGVSAMTLAAFGSVALAGCDDETQAKAVSVTAGGTASASGGKVVTLSSTVEGGTAASTSWTQVAGPQVTLTDAASGTATFNAPGVAAATPLTFRFEAKSSDGITSQADATVTVTPSQLDFTAVAKGLGDTVVVPAGYTVTVLYRTGDPINATTPAYANNGSDTNFAARGGDHHDGMSFFGINTARTAPDPASSTRGLLVLNHENINQAYLHPNGATTVAGARPEGEALKEIECHGVSVIEIAQTSGAWAYVPASAFNRRITPLTPTSFSGPVRGNAALRTVYSPTGVAGRGTINNCANGYMPWGTYLTNEENWAGYFRRDTGDVAARGAATSKANVSLTRYGIPENRPGNYGWATVKPADATSTNFAKWNITVQPGAAPDGTHDFRNEAFQFGWVVEIDPFTNTAVPRKRTALGRMNHEGCWPGRVVAGVRPAFYMGDDAQNEYIYKFVSTQAWSAADATPADRLATGDKYLDAGTLYVAKLNADGSGQWLPLVFGQGPLTATGYVTYSFADQADVLINARLAADALGATKMDRPEWTAVNPVTGEMYCTLTNNTTRTPATTDAANPRAYTDPKLPQGDVVNADPPTTTQATRGNANGHIIRLRETGDTTEAATFGWDIYAFGAGADLNAANINISGLDATNDFSSPDGLWFGRRTNAQGQAIPVMWIETDDGAFTDVTNCMLLAAFPGTVNDGATRTVNNTLTTATNATTTSATATRVGRAPGTTLKRFLVGPKECEITGIDTTPDGRSLFVNIQHPGENGNTANITSNWPANQATGTTSATGPRPRSATIVITKNDGGVVGL